MADSVGMLPENHGQPGQSVSPNPANRLDIPPLLSALLSIHSSQPIAGPSRLMETPPLRLDRVFVHALNTVKKIPKTGASRPPPGDRLRLYGLYKQAMEGDVDGVMERPERRPGTDPDELQRERDKWDAWNAQSGISRTEAKRRYIEALIETMHRYATTP